MHRLCNVAVIFFALTLSAKAQTADTCDRALMERNWAVLQESDVVRLYAASFMARNNMEKESRDLFGISEVGAFDFQEFKQKAERSLVDNRLSYSHDYALSLFLYNLPPDAHETWLKCKIALAPTSVFKVSLGKFINGRNNLFVLWRPADEIAGEALRKINTTVSGLKLPTTLKPGVHGFTLKTTRTGIAGVINGSIPKKSFSVEIYIPAISRKTTEFHYIGKADILPGCTIRGGTGLDKCWNEQSKEINAGPPEQGLSSVTIKIPVKSDRFRATLAARACWPGRAQVYVNVNGQRKLTFGWPETLGVDVSLEGAVVGDDIQIGADALGSAQCDDIRFQNARFVLSSDAKNDLLGRLKANVDKITRTQPPQSK